jgi:hypothetical protein
VAFFRNEETPAKEGFDGSVASHSNIVPLRGWLWHLGGIPSRLPGASKGQIPHASVHAYAFYRT